MDEQDRQFSGPDAYERFMGRWSRLLAPLVVRFADIAGGSTILDVGSGTGALTAAIAAASPTARVTGLDPSAAYVAYAQARTGSSTIHFDVGDAREMSYADESFDHAVSMLAINFIPNPAAALAEMRRVTRRGGTVAAAVWDYGDGMEMLRSFWDAAIRLRPADDGRDERHMALCRKGALSDLWRQGGIERVMESRLEIETRFDAFDDYWMPFTLGQGPAGAYTAALPPEDRENLRTDLRRRLLPDTSDGPVLLKARAWAVKGVVSRIT